MLFTADRVDYVEMSRGENQLPVLVLTVKRNQAAGYGSQVRSGHHPALKICAGPPVWCDPAGQHQLATVERNTLAELGYLRLCIERSGWRENPLHIRFVCPRADDPTPGLSAQQEIERVREQRLAGASLTGDH